MHSQIHTHIYQTPSSAPYTSFLGTDPRRSNSTQQRQSEGDTEMEMKILNLSLVQKEKVNEVPKLSPTSTNYSSPHVCPHCPHHANSQEKGISLSPRKTNKKPIFGGKQDVGRAAIQPNPRHATPRPPCCFPLPLQPHAPGRRTYADDM